MAKLSKRQKLIREKVDRTRAYSVEEAVDLLKDLDQHTNFQESVDLAVNLGVDARKSDQVVRGSTVLPNGTGKSVRIAVFAQGENADKAKEAGADVVGMDDLAEQTLTVLRKNYPDHPNLDKDGNFLSEVGIDQESSFINKATFGLFDRYEPPRFDNRQTGQE